MNYIYDSDATREEIVDYVNKCSVRQAGDTKAFLEILRLCRDGEAEGVEAFVKIAGICRERLKE